MSSVTDRTQRIATSLIGACCARATGASHGAPLASWRTPDVPRLVSFGGLCRNRGPLQGVTLVGGEIHRRQFRRLLRWLAGTCAWQVSSALFTGADLVQGRGPDGKFVGVVAMLW